MSFIAIESVSADYGGDPVLRAVDLTVDAGSLTCVLGPSGCGKTTLLRVIAGFTAARSGVVRIGDRVLDDGRQRLAPEKRRVGYVAQEGALFPHLSVADNVGFALPRASRADRAARAQVVDEMLQLVGMTELAQRQPHQLSGGQQQRVAVARALASRPEVVLLDEPFASLDAELRARLREDIRDVLRRAEVTAILVTHDRAEALSMADQVAVIFDGEVHQRAAPHELYARPHDLQVARFVGDANLIAATVADGVATSRLGVLPLDDAAPHVDGERQGEVLVRPEQLCVHEVGAPATVGRPHALGTVTRVEYYGHDARLEVTVDGAPAPGTVVCRVAGQVPPREGARVAITVTGTAWPLPTTA